MKVISIKDFKESLSHWAEIVNQGDSVLVTKHERPYITVSPPVDRTLILGKRVNQGDLLPLEFIQSTRVGKRALSILLEDRDEDDSSPSRRKANR